MASWVTALGQWGASALWSDNAQAGSLMQQEQQAQALYRDYIQGQARERYVSDPQRRLGLRGLMKYLWVEEAVEEVEDDSFGAFLEKKHGAKAL